VLRYVWTTKSARQIFRRSSPRRPVVFWIISAVLHVRYAVSPSECQKTAPRRA
jgi:hypothetical protein